MLGLSRHDHHDDPDGLAVDAEAPTPVPAQAELAADDAAAVLLHLEGDVQVVLVETDHFVRSAAAVGAPQGEIVEGFEEVGLAFTVSPQDKIDPGRKRELGVVEIAESVDLG